MAQAYLRYLSVRNHLEYNDVVMMFVPGDDLWRDINTIRDLAAGWHTFIVQPRFVIENGDLKLVPSPYADPLDVFLDNREMLSEQLRNHLRRYDRFYFRSLYESPPLIGRLWTYKMYASIYGNNAKEALLRGLMWPDSEAMQVSHKIFSAMQEQTERLGSKFALLVLPTSGDLSKFRADPKYPEVWKAMTKFICADIKVCIDLARPLRTMPLTEIDFGYDRSHYGPRANRQIAEAIFDEFIRRRYQGTSVMPPRHETAKQLGH